MNTSVVSLDIETYGALRGFPPHSVFVPARSVYNDRVPKARQVITVSLTWPEGPVEMSREGLASQVPAATMVLTAQHTPHLRYLCDALHAADVIEGCNLLFDLSYLRAFSPSVRSHLEPFSKTLIDLTICSFLENDVRPSHSLKAIARDYNIHEYKESAATTQYPTLEALSAYNATDTHVTMLCIAEAARRCAPCTHRLSPACLNLYSDTMWSCMLMTENGVPHSMKKVRDLHDQCQATCERLSARLLDEYDLKVEGEGRDASRQAFLDRLLARVPESIRSNTQLLEYSEATGILSWKQMNRALLGLSLPPRETHLREALALIDEHASASKLLTSYIKPLLGQGRGKNPRKKMLIRSRGDLAFSYPVWLITPSKFKDSPIEGGTKQARITCIDPGHQTDPPQIEACRCSRFPGGILVGMDLSQHELRTAGILSGEPAYLRAYNEGQDLHTRRAISLWGAEDLLNRYPELRSLTPDEYKRHAPFNRRERQVGKRGNFADLFRAGPDVIQHAVLGDIGELMGRELFAEMVARRREERPVLWEWQESVIAEARARGKVVLPMTGQTRSFLGGEKYDINEIVNFPVQATAANTLLSLQNALARRIHEQKMSARVKMFLNVYDALKFDVADHEAVQWLEVSIALVVHHEGESGYWARTCASTGHFIPLQYDLEKKEFPL